MRLLLDTHTFIWWDSGPVRLSPTALAALNDPANLLVLSVASVWEMQIKLQLGKLKLGLPLADVIDNQRTANHIEILPVALQHVLALADLPSPHKDPFDRLLASQAHTDNLALVSGDPIFAKYPVALIW